MIGCWCIYTGINQLVSALREASQRGPAGDNGGGATEPNALSQRVTEDILDWMELSQGLDRTVCENILVRLTDLLRNTAASLPSPPPELHLLNYHRLREFVRENFLAVNHMAATDPAADEALVMLSDYLGIDDGMMEVEEEGNWQGTEDFMDVYGDYEDNGAGQGKGWFDPDFRSSFVAWACFKFDMDTDTCLTRVEELESALLPFLRDLPGLPSRPILTADQLRGFLLERQGGVTPVIDGSSAGELVQKSYQRLCWFLGLPIPGGGDTDDRDDQEASGGSSGGENDGSGSGGEEEEEEMTALPSATIDAFGKWLSKRQKIRSATIKEYQRYAESTVHELMVEGDGSFQPLPSRIEVRPFCRSLGGLMYIPRVRRRRVTFDLYS